MTNNKTPKEQLLSSHKSVAFNAREALQFLTKGLAENTSDEEKFFEVAGQAGSAALMLQRISSALSALVALEQELMERQAEIDRIASSAHVITRQDLEIIFDLMRNWGLLKDNCDEEIEKVTKTYENNEGDYQ